MTLPGEPHPLDYPGAARPQARRTFLKRLLVALGYTGAGAVVGGGSTSILAPASHEVTPLAGGGFDFFSDAPVGVVIYYEGSLNAHPNLPSGASPKWSVIAVDRVLVGVAASGDGTEGGTESLTAEVAHAGASNASAGGHQHDAHTTAQALGAVLSQVLTGPTTHASDGAHTHVFTEPNTHAVKNWHKAFTLKKVLA